MSKFYSGTLVGAMLCAAPLAAQDVTHSTAVGLGVSQIKIDGESASGLALDAETTIGIDRVDVDVDFGLSRLSDDGISVNRTTLAVAPSYWFTPIFAGGLYLSRDSLDFDGLATVDTTSYGLEFELAYDGVSVATFAGESDMEGLSTRDVGAKIKGDFSDEVSLWASGVTSRVDGAGTDYDLWSYGVGGSLLMDNGVGSYVSFQTQGIENTGMTADSAAIGVSYTTNLGGRNVMFNGEYASLSGDTDFGSVDGDRFSLGATILLGDAKRKRTAADSVTANTVSPARNAMSSGLSAIGF